MRRRIQKYFKKNKDELYEKLVESEYNIIQTPTSVAGVIVMFWYNQEKGRFTRAEYLTDKNNNPVIGLVDPHRYYKNNKVKL